VNAEMSLFELKDKLYAISNVSTFTATVSGGYFIWDLVVCILYLKVTGWEFLLHAIYCSFVYVGLVVLFSKQLSMSF
jgi:hypothetical protein